MHERAWIFVVDGEIEIEGRHGETVTGGPGLPRARRAERAARGPRGQDARLLVLAALARRGSPLAAGRTQASRADRRALAMRALLYDIHGNLPALEAVIADARAAGAERLRARRRLRALRRLAGGDA